MRFSDKLNHAVETIKAHNTVISSEGAVWLAKAGKPMAHNHIATINRQCDAGIPTYLYLVQRVREEYKLYRASVLAMTRKFPGEEQSLVPPYYETSPLLHDVQLWAKLSEIKAVPNKEIDTLVLVSTATPARSSLMYSMAGLFLVRRVSPKTDGLSP